MVSARALAFAMAGLASSSAMAGLIVSGDGDETCRVLSAGASSCTVQTISVHSKWQPNDPHGQGAAWISYADTGVLGSTLAVAPDDGDPATPDAENPLMKVREVLTGIAAGDRLIMDLWADDTARAELLYDNGADFPGFFASLVEPNFTQDTCADGPPGCEPGELAHIKYTFTEGDLETLGGRNVYLDFTTFQVGTGTTNASNPFGLLYSGRLDPAGERTVTAVPEPSSFGLLLSGALLGLMGRRRS